MSELDVDFARAAALGNEFISRINAIREADPVFWSEIQQGWIISRYQDVADGFWGKHPLSCVRLDTIAFRSVPEEQWPTRLPLLTTALNKLSNYTDPPLHTRLRKPLNVAFSKKNVEAVRPFVRRRIQQLLDVAQGRGEFEFVETIARPLTGSVIMGLMGVPEAHAVRLRDWANNVTTAIGSARPTPETLDEGERSMREMDAVFTEELDKRRRSPSDDFLSSLLPFTQGDERLSHPELLAIFVNTLLAGHDSTAATMTLGVHALAQHPQQVRYMLDNPERIVQSVAEISRFVAMNACQTRLAAQDFEWHGKHIRKGDPIYLMVAGANRDPRKFPDPEQLDLSRNCNDTAMTFAPGIHHCVGHLLAKLQLGEFFPAAFKRFEVDLLDDRIDFAPGYAFRPVLSMNVRFRPVRTADVA